MSIRELERKMQLNNHWEDLGFPLEELLIQKPRIKMSECWTKTEEGVVLISHPSLPYFFKLNRTATEIWEMCDGSRQINDVIRKFEEIYGIGENEKGEILETILIFYRLSLIEFGDSYEDSSY
jgi:hypothetical protein